MTLHISGKGVKVLSFLFEEGCKSGEEIIELFYSSHLNYGRRMYHNRRNMNTLVKLLCDRGFCVKVKENGDFKSDFFNITSNGLEFIEGIKIREGGGNKRNLKK